MKTGESFRVEEFLRNIEGDYVSACARFISREPKRDHVWVLRKKDGEILSLIINSKSTLLPVLCGRKEIPSPKFLKGFLRFKKIHSLQGLLDEVIILENELEKMGRIPADIIDYELMTLDKPPLKKNNPLLSSNLLLRIPKMTDFEAIAPLQEGYEKEEVIPKGSNFNPASSRINIANIIAKGQVLAAEIDGRLVGKINVSAVSFTRYQIGGVYVHPDFRSMGIAGRMTADFLSPLINEGRGITLFVKKSNTPAKRLYAGLGFVFKKDYRITYY